MKYVLISIAIIVIATLVVVGNKKQAQDPLPPQEATLAGPQEPLPAKEYNPSAPLSKNKIILQNNMKIEITKEGAGPEIKNGQTAEVKYVGTFENGTSFDQGTIPFTLGAGQVIKGWDQGILGMKVGESRILTIPSDLAYGPNGYGPIPPSATLIFDVTLLAIK